MHMHLHRKHSTTPADRGSRQPARSRAARKTACVASAACVALLAAGGASSVMASGGATSPRTSDPVRAAAQRDGCDGTLNVSFKKGDAEVASMKVPDCAGRPPAFKICWETRGGVRKCIGHYRSERK